MAFIPCPSDTGRYKEAIIKKNAASEMKLISAVCSLRKSPRIIKIPVEQCSIFSPPAVLPSDHIKVITKALRMTKEWDARAPCTVIPNKGKNVYHILDDCAYLLAARAAKIKVAVAMIFPFVYENLTENERELLQTYVRLGKPCPARKDGIMQQVSEMKTLVERYNRHPTFAPINPRFGLNKSELARLVPSPLAVNAQRHFLLEKDDKVNRGARHLIESGVLERFVDLEAERAACHFTLANLKSFAVPGATREHLREQVKSWEKSSKRTGRYQVSVPGLVYRVSKRVASSSQVTNAKSTQQGVPPKEPRPRNLRSDGATRKKTSSTSAICIPTKSQGESAAVRPVNERDRKRPQYGFQKLVQMFGSVPLLLTQNAYDRVMSDSMMLSDSLVDFGASEILAERGRDVFFISGGFSFPDSSVQDAPVRPSFGKEVIESHCDTIAFGVTGMNHHSLACAFGVRDIFEWIVKGNTNGSSRCPLRIVHFDSCPSVGHYKIIRQNVVPWVRRFLRNLCARRGKPIPQTPKALDAQGIRDLDHLHLPKEQLRLAEALCVYILKSVPLQSDSVSCGWHALRALWIVADKYLTKFQINQLPIKQSRLNDRPYKNPSGTPTMELESCDAMVQIFRNISIENTRTRVRAALQSIAILQDQSEVASSALFAWNKSRRDYVEAYKKNSEIYGKKQKSLEMPLKRAISSVERMELRPLRKLHRTEGPLQVELPGSRSLHDLYGKSVRPLLSSCHESLRKIQNHQKEIRSIFEPSDVDLFMEHVSKLRRTVGETLRNGSSESFQTAGSSKNHAKKVAAANKLRRSEHPEKNDGLRVAKELLEEVLLAVERRTA